MDIEAITALVAGWDGALALTPRAGDGTPQIAWGDTFFYYAPDGVVPTTTQPFATIVTKNYPDDATSQLDRPGVFRVNVSVGRAALPGVVTSTDPAALDVFFAHPVYGALGWVSVLNPGPQTSETLRTLLRNAYEAARHRWDRRQLV